MASRSVIWAVCRAGGMKSSVTSNSGRGDVRSTTQQQTNRSITESLRRSSFNFRGPIYLDNLDLRSKSTEQKPISAKHVGTRLCDSMPDCRRGTPLRCSMAAVLCKDQDSNLHMMATGSGEKNGWPALCRHPGLPRLETEQLTSGTLFPSLYSQRIRVTKSDKPGEEGMAYTLKEMC